MQDVVVGGPPAPDSLIGVALKELADTMDVIRLIAISNVNISDIPHLRTIEASLDRVRSIAEHIRITEKR